MNIEKAKNWMRIFNDKIQANQNYLSELDTPIGDGDHGGNMARGMKAVIEVIDPSEYESVNDLFKAVSMQLLSKVGGASGPLYGSAFMGIAKDFQEDRNLEEILQCGLQMIQKRGKAETGEKTMVDVWAKVIDLIKNNQLTPEAITEAVEATKDMRATKGRASYVGERSIGHIDPGAQSSGYLFESLLEAEVI